MHRRSAAALDNEVRALHLVACLHRDRHAVAALDLGDEAALVVEDIERHRRRRHDVDRRARVLDQMILQSAQHREGHTFNRADHAGTLAMRALRRRPFEHAGAHALPAHFHQTEVRDAPHLNAGAIKAQCIGQPVLDLAVIALLLHVDEIDHDETSEIAQLQLPGDFIRRFQVGRERRFLDRILACGLARVDIDGNQRLGLVDNQIAARLQRNVRAEHGVQLLFDRIAGEQRLRLVIFDDVLDMARHQHAHEVGSVRISLLARHYDLVDLLGIKIADRALDQVAFFIDEARCGRLQRHLADAFPQAQQVFVVALDLLARAGGTGRTDDQPHALRHIKFLRDGFQPLAITRGNDLARDATAAAGVRHQHGIAAGQR